MANSKELKANIEGLINTNKKIANVLEIVWDYTYRNSLSIEPLTIPSKNIEAIDYLVYALDKNTETLSKLTDESGLFDDIAWGE